MILSVSLTQAFMKPINDTSSVTEVSLTSCAKISLTDSGSIDLNNSYPMSRNKSLQTTPYSFIVNSSCEGYVGFNLYIATLSTNTLDAIKVHYILTYKDSKTALAEGTLTTDKIVTNEFSEAEKTEYNAGMKGTLNNIYKIYELNLSTETSYDLYLYIDEAGNETMNKTFKAGVAIKSFDRESTFSDYIIAQYTMDGKNGLYHFDGKGDYVNADLEINDNSYRYVGGDYQLTEKAKNEEYTHIFANSAEDTGYLINFYCNGEKKYDLYCSPMSAYNYTLGESSTGFQRYYEILEYLAGQGYLEPLVKNYVCFGSDEKTCPEDNLYRVIGVFEDKVKLIKAYEADEIVLGKIDNSSENVQIYSKYYNGKKDKINGYYWSGHNTSNNDWSSSTLNTNNLNGTSGNTYLTILGEKWSSLISDTQWVVSGNATRNIINDLNIFQAFVNEIISPYSDRKLYKSKIGLMYVSDYGYASSPENWTTSLSEYNNEKNQSNNWLYMGWNEYTISPMRSISESAIYGINFYGYIWVPSPNVYYCIVRPTFYLNSNVKYVSGTGTETDPYRIA